MSNFRLSRLSYISQRSAIGQMTFKEIMALSLTFGRLKPIIKGLNLSVEIFSLISDSYVELRVKHKADEPEIEFSTDDVSLGTPTRNVDGMDVQVELFKNSFKFKTGMDSTENNAIFGHVLKHLMDIVKVEKISVISIENIFKTCVFEHTTKLSQLLLFSEDITCDQARVLFENSEIAELIFGRTQIIGENGREMFAFNNEYISFVKPCQWLNYDSILTMKCAVFKLRAYENVRMQDLTNIVKAWMDGGIPNLKKLVINTNEELHRSELFNILEKWENVTISAERDQALIRRSDGKTATVKMDYYFRVTATEST